MNNLFRENLPETEFSSDTAFSSENPPTDKFIVFSPGEELFAVSVSNVAEVVQMPAVTALPNLPEWLSGIANLRGEIISVIDLAKYRNGKPAQISSKSKLIVLRSQNSDSPIALTADRLAEIINLPVCEIDFSEENPPYIYGRASHHAKTLNLLDTEKLISRLEI